MIEKIFSRKSPKKHAEQAMYQNGWITIPYRLVESVSERRQLYGQWVKLESDKGSIYRIASFSGNMKGSLKNNEPAELVVDWSGWLELQGYADKVAETVQVRITKVRLYEKILIYFQPFDPYARLAAGCSLMFTLIGVFLGYFISVISR